MPMDLLANTQQQSSGPVDLLAPPSMQGMAKSTMQGGQDALNLLNTPLKKTLGGQSGTSFEEDAREKSLAGQDVAPATQRPFDSRLGAVAPEAFNNATIGQEKDLLSTPSMMLGASAKGAMEAGEGIGNAVASVKNGIAKAALSDFAQDAGDLKYGHDARRVMASMPDIVGEDAVSTKAAIQNKLQETGQAIGQTIKANPETNVPVGVNEKDIVGHIDDKIGELNQADPKGNLRTIRALEAKKVALLNNFDTAGNPIGPIDFEKMTPGQLFDYKQSKLGDIKYTGRVGVDESALNSALQESRANITSKINAKVPDVASLNQDYGDLKSASDSIDKVIMKQQREGLNGLGIKNLLSIGLNNPTNRIKLAQWLYTAPKPAIAQLEVEVPNAAETIKSWFGEKAPALGMAGSAGSKALPIVDNLKDMDANATGKPFAQPAVAQEPAETTKGFGGPELSMEAEGSPAKEQSLPSNLAATVGIGTAAVASTNANAQNVDIKKINKIESSNNPKKYNHRTGAIGLNQIRLPVLKEWNSFHPNEKHTTGDLMNGSINNKISNWYYNQRIPSMLKNFRLPDTLENRLAAYNYGIGNLAAAIKRHRPLPKETTDYIRKYRGIK